MADPHAWIQSEPFRTTADVPLPKLLIDEVIGQEEAVEVAKKAARQRRHLLLLGDPGTGKSMIAKAMAQILPAAQLDDVLCYANPKDENTPQIVVAPGGQGRREFRRWQRRARRLVTTFRVFEWFMVLALLTAGVAGGLFYTAGGFGIMIFIMSFIAAVVFLGVARQLVKLPERLVPNLLIERAAGTSAVPYVEATGSHSGSLLGDVRHDPFQSGGLQTPTHMRVEPGAIHKAHKGVLFIDEINTLRLDSQLSLLTATQEKKFAITGQSERSSGALARTEPVPCDFILVAAGNLDVIHPTDARTTGLHPALRSRIRGYGYEVYVRSVMEDTDENRRRLIRFVAQEVRRDGRIPHFTSAAVAEIIREAQRRSGKNATLTLRLRELGGLVRTAGDLARDEGSTEVRVEHVHQAKRISESLEQQVTRRAIEITTAPEAIESTTAPRVGTAIGCAFLGTGETGEPAGIVVPVEAEVTTSGSRQGGGVYLSGGLERDRSVFEAVAAALKRRKGAQMAGLDVHCQSFLEQPANVHALGAAAVVASLSAITRTPVRGDTVIIGTLSVGGRLRRVEALTQMIEGAADLGYVRAIVPASNRNDILLGSQYRNRIQIVLARDIDEVLRALAGPATKAPSPNGGRTAPEAVKKAA